MLGFPVKNTLCDVSSSKSGHNLNETFTISTYTAKPNIVLEPHIRRDDIKKIISSFESKDYKLFFELWQKLIPNSIKESNIYRELTFYLYVYFATLPYRQTEDENEEKKTVIDNEVMPENKDNEDNETLDEKVTVKEEVNDEINSPVTDNGSISDIDKGNRVDKKINNNKIEKMNNKEKLNENTPNEDGVKNIENNRVKKIKDEKVDIEVSVKGTKDFLNVEKNEFIKNNNNHNIECFINSNNNKIVEKDNKNDNFYENFKEELNRKIQIMNINKNEDYELNRVKKPRKKSDDFDADSLNTSIREETNQNSEEESDDNEMKVKESDVINVEKEVDKFSTKGDVNEKDINEEDDTDNSSISTKNEMSIKESSESAMDVLRTFLTTKGPEFSSEPDFLPYFALPFIHNPHNHPSFVEIFKESWALNMERRLIDFIKQYSYGSTVTPTLMRLQSSSLTTENTNENELEKNHYKRLPTPQRTTRSQSTTPIKVISSPQLQESMNDSNRRYKNMKWKFQKLHRDHQNLIGVAAELTNALENSVRGQAVDLKATLNNCVKIFPELFSKSRLSTAEDNNSKREMRLSCQSDDMPCYHLDVQKIKQHLATASIKAKLLLLQALRWRLTRTTGDERDQIVTWISQHDVLSLRYNGSCPVLEEMLISPGTCTPHPLQQAVARLLNTIASLRCGRDYLAPSHNLLSLLVSTLKQDNVRIDQTTADMLLATLQKLSLRRNQRLWMIEEGVVVWLIDRMKMQTAADTENNSESSVAIAGAYTLEYSTALLMNLCLHEEARQRFPPLLISVLIRLLDTTHIQILPVVAGTLYCLLTRDDINEVAKELEFENTVTVITQKFSNDQSLVRQLETLLRLHLRQINIETLQTVSDDQNEDEMDDPEELEQELDVGDPVRAMPGDLAGDDLLNRLYSCPTSIHGTTATSEGAGSMMSL